MALKIGPTSTGPRWIIHRGASFTFGPFVVVDLDGAARSLVGCTVRLLIGRSLYKVPQFEANVGTGVTVTDAPNGELKIELSAQQTGAFDEGGIAYELLIVDQAGAVILQLKGQGEIARTLTGNLGDEVLEQIPDGFADMVGDRPALVDAISETEDLLISDPERAPARLGRRKLKPLLDAKADADDMTAALAAKANTSDVATALAGKADATATTTALALKAPLASPALTGTPTAPTPATSDNGTRIATTAMVKAALAELVASSPAALDTLNELAAALGNDANFAASMTAALAAKQDATFSPGTLGPGSVERGVVDELRDLGVPVERYGAVSGASDDATAGLINASTAEDGTGVVEHHSRALSSPIILKGEGREYRLTSPLVLPPCAALTIRDITLVVDDAFVGTHAIRAGDGDALYASDALETRITALKLENVTIDCRHVGGVAAKTATYVSATSFSVVGDQTAAFSVGGLVAVNGSATGYIGGVITASVFSSVTTVTVKFNRGSLANEALTAMPLGVGVGGLYVNRHYTVDIDGLRVLHSAGVAIQSDMDSDRVKTSHSFNLRNVDVREWTQYETPHPILGDGFADATKRCGVGLRLDSFDYHLSKVDIGYCAYAFDIKAAGGEFVQFHPYGGFGSIQHVTGAGSYIAHSMSFIGCHFDNIRDVLVRNPYYGMNFVACKFMSFSASSVKFLLLRCESALAARINVTSCIFYQSTVVSGTEALSLDEATASFTSITGVMLGNDFENVTPHEFIGIRSATQTQWNLTSKVAGTIASLNLRDAETLKYQLVKLANNDAGFYDATSGTYAWYVDATSGQIRFDRCKLIRVEYNQVTSANLASASNAVNTTNKAAGTVVELSDGTPGRIMRARGSTPTSPWVDLTGGNTVTPA